MSLLPPQLKPKSILPCILLSLSIGGCGGGGSDDSSGTTAPPPSTGGNETPEWSAPQKVLSSLMMDANGDGHVDILVASYSDQGYSTPQLLVNDGNASFAELDNAVEWAGASESQQTIHMAQIDANGDEYADLIAVVTEADYSSSSFKLLLGSASGQFTEQSGNIADDTFTGWGEVIVADFDNDTNQDFILSYNPNGASCEVLQSEKNGCLGGTIYLNDGNGSFTPATIQITDTLDNNQYASNTLDFSDKSNGFVNGSSAAIWRVEVGDLNVDGLLDVVSPTFGEREIPTFVNESSPGQLAFRVIYSDIPLSAGGGSQLLDINQDGIKDLVMSEAIYNGAEVQNEDMTTPVYLAINDGNGNFTLANDLFDGAQPTVQHARAWIVKDFDQDGSDDLFVADHGYDFSPFTGFRNLLLLNSVEGLRDATEASLGSENTFTHGASAGDVNGDGFPDLYLNNDLQLTDTNPDAAQAIPRLWLNNGDGTFNASAQDL
ncbi:MAG: FG-GAP repeat domain-containing protein [Alteromonas oceani]